MGLKPSPGHRGYYYREGEPETLYDSMGQGTNEPECWTCKDLGFVSVRPIHRASKGAWDSDLAMCPERCREEAGG